MKAVDVTLLFSLRENAIAKEPGLSYPERRRCVPRLGASLVAVKHGMTYVRQSQQEYEAQMKE